MSEKTEKIEKIRSLESRAWEMVVSECYHLTLAEIANMKPGQKIKILLLHDTALKQCHRINKINVAHRPEAFFRNEYATYTHIDDLNGILKLPDNQEVPFEFSIMIAPNTWYPLTKGKLKKVAKSPLQEDLIGKHYREFDPMTPVGWRGSAIPWKHLAALPLIHHIEDVTLGVV